LNRSLVNRRQVLRSLSRTALVLPFSDIFALASPSQQQPAPAQPAKIGAQERNYEAKPAPPPPGPKSPIEGTPLGVNFVEVATESALSGKTIYGDVNGRVEVTGEVIQDGRTVRSKYHVRLSFDAPVCPADFVGEIQRGLAALDQVKYGPIGLTPKGVPYVTEISPDYNNGVKAYDRKDYQLALMWLTPLADKGHTKARYYLGWMYQNGLGVAIDYPKAAYWYRLAADGSLRVCRQFASSGLACYADRPRRVKGSFSDCHLT